MSVNRAFLIDATQSIDDRVEYLLEQMTLDEKIAQLGSYWIYEILQGTTFAPDKANQLLTKGIGHITRMAGASNVRPHESAELGNNIQKFLIENTRLGIPAIIHEECCSGYMARGATVFPQAIGIASTWEPELIKEMANVIRSQMRSVGAHHALAPVLDVARDARWGRTEETFGEDPYLIAELGVAYIKGLQSDNLAEGIVATGKHFVGYGMSEGGLNWAPPHISWREMREVYLFPFEAAVREANLYSMMNAYHELDGVPCGLSKELLTDILRGEWGFEGTVVSDYFAINMLNVYHHVVTTKAQAAQASLEAGLDVELPFTDCYGEPLREAVERGEISQDLLNVSVRRVLTQKFVQGIFENPYVDAGKVAFDTAEDRQLARTLAQKSIVLLKNENHILPLSKETKSIALIGPNADSVRNLFGDYAFPAHIETLMESRNQKNVFNQPLPDDIESADDFIEAISILNALKAKVGSDVNVHYAKGCEIIDPSTDGFEEAIQAAKASEFAIVVVGDKAGLTDDCTSGEARDRADLNLPGVQNELVQAVCATGTPVILVLINGRPSSLDGLVDSVSAIVEAWLPSEEGANAVADVLFGDVNPGGKLPITFPRTVGQIPIFYGHRPSGGRSHWKENYVETSVKPLYPFGFGLSYTEFKFDNLKISPDSPGAGDEVLIQVDVTNVGDCAGDEVVQVYIHQAVPIVTRPIKELKAFKRITLEAKETRTVSFYLAVNQLGFYDLNQEFIVQPGKVDVMVGNSSQNLPCIDSFEIGGAKTNIVDSKVFFSRAEVS